MKKKTARRFLNRSKWKIACLNIWGWPDNSFTRRIMNARKALGDIRFRIF